MPLILKSSGGGGVTLDVPSTASNFTYTYPAETTTVVGVTSTQTLTNKTIGTGYGGGAVVSGTAQNTTSGTSIDFTGIPSWVKKITVMLNGISTNGSSIALIQIGDSGGIENTGYSAIGQTVDILNTAQTTGFPLAGSWANYVNLRGIATIALVSGSTWVYNTLGSQDGGGSLLFMMGAGTKTLSSTLDRIRLTTVNGTDTFDAGSINILYE